MKPLEIAKTVLTSKGGFLHVNEMATIAHEMELCSDQELKDLPKLLSSALNKEVKTKKPVFSKIKDDQGGHQKGVYRLKRSMRFPRNRWGES